MEFLPKEIADTKFFDPSVNGIGCVSVRQFVGMSVEAADDESLLGMRLQHRQQIEDGDAGFAAELRHLIVYGFERIVVIQIV